MVSTAESGAGDRGMTVVPLHSLPLGFRFHPKDEELVNHYLKRKITGKIKSEVEVIPEIDVCKCEPWDLPAKSLIKSEDPEWFLFAPKDRKYPNSHRSNRATKIGYWKATGRDREIRSSAGKIIGMKKTLVFHRGRAPKGVRTHWVMHEYRTTEPEFEYGDQGGYFLYRLFDKTPVDKNSSSNTADMEIGKFSPDDTQHFTNLVDEIEIQSNHGSPKSDSQEELLSLPHSGEKQGKGDCSTGISVKPELNCCNLISPDEVTKMGEKDVLTQISDSNYGPIGHNFPNVSSSSLQLSDADQEFRIRCDPTDNDSEDDLNVLLESIINTEDCTLDAYLSPKESSPDSLVKDSPLDSVSCKDSGTSSDIETEPFLTQDTADLETSQWFHGSPLVSTDSLQMDGCVYPETSHLNTLHENAYMLSYNFTVPDVCSVDFGMESLEADLFNILEEPNNQKTISDNGEDFEMTGIKIRSREMQQLGPHSENVVLQQGTAVRRLLLQRSIRKVAVSNVGSESGSAADGSKNSPTKATQSLSNSVEELTSQKNTIDETDDHVETEIKIKARDVQLSPDMFVDKISRIVRPQCRLQETVEVEENVSDSTSEAGENTASTFLDKHREISNDDADETPSCSSMQQESEFVLRLRNKTTNKSDKELKHSHSIPREPMARQALASVLYLVLSVVLVLMCLVGMWMSMRSPVA